MKCANPIKKIKDVLTETCIIYIFVRRPVFPCRAACDDRDTCVDI